MVVALMCHNAELERHDGQSKILFERQEYSPIRGIEKEVTWSKGTTPDTTSLNPGEIDGGNWSCC